MAVQAQKAVNQRLMAAFNSHDAVAMSECYTDDCCFINGGDNTLLRGQKELVPAFEAMFKKYRTLYFEATDQTVMGDQITEVGKFCFKLNDSEEEHNGRYVSLTVKRNGKWLCHYDMMGNC